MKTESKKLTKLTCGDFTFEASTVCHDRFDLIRAGKNKKTGKPTRSIEGYGYSFEDGIEKMIRVRLGERENITTLKGYADEYKKAKEEIQNLLK
jgi:hypothetical protein